MSIRGDEQRLALDAVVQLVTIDAAAIGGSLVRLTPGPLDGRAVAYKGVGYQAAPVRVTGVRHGGRGGGGEPTLEAAADHAALLALAAGSDNLAGATVKLLETLEPYLDGRPGADATRHWPEQEWRVEALAGRDPKTLSWRLGGLLTFDGARLPRRQALRDVCSWEYRRWDGGKFVYGDRVECPYAGGKYFDAEDNAVTDPALDNCSRRIGGCQARYPNNALLPFGGFVGLGRSR